jgi:hypothetical protein
MRLFTSSLLKVQAEQLSAQMAFKHHSDDHATLLQRSLSRALRVRLRLPSPGACAFQ